VSAWTIEYWTGEKWAPLVNSPDAHATVIPESVCQEVARDGTYIRLISDNEVTYYQPVDGRDMEMERRVKAGEFAETESR
jgi:hypothetical protein